MRLPLTQLRQLVAEVVIDEAGKISASPAYLQKEKVREHVQRLIIDAVKSKSIASQADFDDFCRTADMALKALAQVPFAVYAKMAGAKKN
jgi:hypothetical protein